MFVQISEVEEEMSCLLTKIVSHLPREFLFECLG